MSGLHEVQVPGNRVAEYHAPATLAEALGLVAADPTAQVVAGGTDLLLELARGDRPDVGALVDLTRISGLDSIQLVGDRVVLGPLVTHNQVVASELAVERALPLAQACLEVGSPQLRNRATVVGNLVTASPANDSISALLALDAELTLASVSGERTVALADFYPGFRSTVLGPGELVTGISFPGLEPDQRGVFVKLGLRRAQAISVVHSAMVLRFAADDSVSEATIALGSVAPVVITAPAVSAALIGGPLTDDTIAAAAASAQAQARPIDDLRATGEYRTEAVAVMVKRGLIALRDGLERSAWPSRPPLLVNAPPMPEPGPSTSRNFGTDDSITVRVNGQQVTAPGATGVTLLDWLRDPAHDEVAGSLRGSLEGCAEGECGACTVHLEGMAVMSCLVPAARADGATVVTIEGLADETGPHRLQQAFVECFAVQCGFCIPGFLMAGASLLEEIPGPDDQQIRMGLAGNLCRCTGYYKIIQAVQEASGEGVT